MDRLFWLGDLSDKFFNSSLHVLSENALSWNVDPGFDSRVDPIWYQFIGVPPITGPISALPDIGTYHWESRSVSWCEAPQPPTDSNEIMQWSQIIRLAW